MQLDRFWLQVGQLQAISRVCKRTEHASHRKADRCMLNSNRYSRFKFYLTVWLVYAKPLQWYLTSTRLLNHSRRSTLPGDCRKLAVGISSYFLKSKTSTSYFYSPDNHHRWNAQYILLLQASSDCRTRASQMTKSARATLWNNVTRPSILLL